VDARDKRGHDESNIERLGISAHTGSSPFSQSTYIDFPEPGKADFKELSIPYDYFHLGIDFGKTGKVFRVDRV